MGVQKHKRSKSRTRKKRSAWARLDAPNNMECPQCHEPKIGLTPQLWRISA
jgi:large subunit ribosomal protein L32